MQSYERLPIRAASAGKIPRLYCGRRSNTRNGDWCEYRCLQFDQRASGPPAAVSTTFPARHDLGNIRDSRDSSGFRSLRRSISTWKRTSKAARPSRRSPIKRFNLGGGDLPERISGAVVSPSLFPLLGVEPIKGRTFAHEEQGEGHDDVIVISERLWKRRFSSDPVLVGKSLLLNGRSYTVIGVMPAKFEFPIPLFGIQGNQFAERVDIWKPIAFTPLELKERGSRSYWVDCAITTGCVGGQSPGGTRPIISHWIQTYPDNYSGGGFGAQIYPFQDQVVGGMRTGLAILLGAVVFVLLIACANLATMLLARASARERELAIRVALGAGRWRLLRQMLTESVLLALAGAAAGIFLSVWGLELLKRIGARTVPRLAEVNVDLVVLIVTAMVAVGTGILFGLIPALATAKPELTEALKEGGRSSTTGARTQSGAQFSRRRRDRACAGVARWRRAFAEKLCASARHRSRIRSSQCFDGGGRSSGHEISAARKRRLPEGEAMINFWNEALRRVRQLPGVEAAGFTTILPLSGSNTDSSFSIEGRRLVKTNRDRMRRFALSRRIISEC